MASLFFFLGFVSFISFFVALIKPSWFKMKSRKQSSTIFAGAFVFFMITGGFFAPAEETPPIINTPVTSAVTEPVATTKPKSRDRLMAQAIEIALGATTNMGKGRVVSVEITPYKSSELSGYGYKSTDTVQAVFIKVNGSENLTPNLQKLTLTKEASQIFQTIFSSFPQTGDIIIWERLPVSDQYGNKKDDTAIVYAMGRPLYEKIKWANFSYTALPDLLKSEKRSDDRNSYYEAIRFQ